MHLELIAWYARHSRPLPWREPSATPWSILVCEVMSQQTPVARVIPSWTAWMSAWPTPRDLAEASPAEVILAWGKLGYPRRALRLRECASVIANEWGNEVPRDRDDLLSLPGVGPYTADAVLAFAYHQRSIVLDTNIRRVLARLEGRQWPSPSIRASDVTNADRLVPQDPDLAWQYNAAIMELGALVCTARSPRCGECPLRGRCEWFAAGKPESPRPHRTQRYAGTHREARGRILAVLREVEAPLSREELATASGLTPARYDEALASLVADGLVTDAGGYGLPEV